MYTMGSYPVAYRSGTGGTAPVGFSPERSGSQSPLPKGRSRGPRQAGRGLGSGRPPGGPPPEVMRDRASRAALRSLVRALSKENVVGVAVDTAQALVSLAEPHPSYGGRGLGEFSAALAAASAFYDIGVTMTPGGGWVRVTPATELTHGQTFNGDVARGFTSAAWACLHDPSAMAAQQAVVDSLYGPGHPWHYDWTRETWSFTPQDTDPGTSLQDFVKLYQSEDFPYGYYGGVGEGWYRPEVPPGTEDWKPLEHFVGVPSYATVPAVVIGDEPDNWVPKPRKFRPGHIGEQEPHPDFPPDAQPSFATSPWNLVMNITQVAGQTIAHTQVKPHPAPALEDPTKVRPGTKQRKISIHATKGGRALYALVNFAFDNLEKLDIIHAALPKAYRAKRRWFQTPDGKWHHPRVTASEKMNAVWEHLGMIDMAQLMVGFANDAIEDSVIAAQSKPFRDIAKHTNSTHSFSKMQRTMQENSNDAQDNLGVDPVQYIPVLDYNPDDGVITATVGDYSATVYGKKGK